MAFEYYITIPTRWFVGTSSSEHSASKRFSCEHSISSRRKRITGRHESVDKIIPIHTDDGCGVLLFYRLVRRPPASKSRRSAARQRSLRPVDPCMNIDETRSVSLRQKLYDRPRRAFGTFSGPPRRIQNSNGETSRPDFPNVFFLGGGWGESH